MKLFHLLVSTLTLSRKCRIVFFYRWRVHRACLQFGKIALTARFSVFSSLVPITICGSVVFPDYTGRLVSVGDNLIYDCSCRADLTPFVRLGIAMLWANIFARSSVLYQSNPQAVFTDKMYRSILYPSDAAAVLWIWSKG
ncbi:hypothetical protein RRG08_005187 [Elysia crispata]|uniref:Uncharacterized protein n=1 Tax=Elysia crispata TaxID=231223 RepID=A0AAE0ZHE5_9GAST|nr:hypothetical protein RRG08_005187 [Elysia crispata]